MRLFSPALWASVLLGFVVGPADKGTPMSRSGLASASPAMQPATLWRTPF
jgi:hypothetical protein